MELKTFSFHLVVVLALNFLVIVKCQKHISYKDSSQFDKIRNEKVYKTKHVEDHDFGVDLFDISEKHLLNGDWIDPFDMAANVEGDYSDWIDPFDMSPPRNVRSAPSGSSCTGSSEKCVSYLQRFINIFITAVGLKGDLPSSDLHSVHTIKFEFLINGKDLKILNDFALNGEQKGMKLEDIGDVLARILPQRATNKGFNSFGLNIGSIANWAKQMVLKMVSTTEWTVISSMFLMLSMTLWFAHSHSYRLALFSFLLTVFCGGFSLTWLRMVEEKEVERYVSMIGLRKNAPYHCSGDPLAWYEHIFYRMFGTDCLEFYQMRDVRTILKVSPTDVLAQTFSSMFINPAANFGKAYGSFVESITSSVPFYLKPIAIIMAFILPLIFFVIILCFLFSYEISLSPFHFSLKPGLFSNYCVPNTASLIKDNKYIEDLSKERGNVGPCLSSLISDNKSSPLYVVTNWVGLNRLSPKDKTTRPNPNPNEINEDLKTTVTEAQQKSSSIKTDQYKSIKCYDETEIEEELDIIFCDDCTALDHHRKRKGNASQTSTPNLVLTYNNCEKLDQSSCAGSSSLT